MDQKNTDSIYRTTTTRTWKMLAIMIGICISGSAIFFSMWDYWTSQPPNAGSSSIIVETTQTDLTGIEVPVSLSFVESSDFRTLAFNAMPGEENHNPEIKVNVGDKVIFDVINDGKSFHAFAVTSSNEGFNEGVIEESKIASSSNPLKPGESGNSFFIPPEAGAYYYICTVPGHREQGMEGSIIATDYVHDDDDDDAKQSEDSIHREYTLSFVESSDFRTLAFNAMPGEENHNPEIKVNVGDTITIKSINQGKSFHAFGIVKDPENFNDIIWDSAIQSAYNPLKPGDSGESTFVAEKRGSYYYICTVPGHALQGMQGIFVVE